MVMEHVVSSVIYRAIPDRIPEPLFRLNLLGAIHHVFVIRARWGSSQSKKTILASLQPVTVVLWVCVKGAPRGVSLENSDLKPVTIGLDHHNETGHPAPVIDEVRIHGTPTFDSIGHTQPCPRPHRSFRVRTPAPTRAPVPNQIK